MPTDCATDVKKNSAHAETREATGKGLISCLGHFGLEGKGRRRPVHARRGGSSVALADYFAFAARDATFHDTRRDGAGPHNVCPPRSRTNHGADPTEATLVQTQARRQGLRSLGWVQEEEGVGEPTGSEKEPRSSPWFLLSLIKTLRTNDSVPTAIVGSFVFARTLSIMLVARCTATVASATPADLRHPSSLALPA